MGNRSQLQKERWIWKIWTMYSWLNIWILPGIWSFCLVAAMWCFNHFSTALYSFSSIWCQKFCRRRPALTSNKKNVRRGCLVTKNKKSWTIKLSNWSKFSEWIRCSTHHSNVVSRSKKIFFCLDEMRVWSIKTNLNTPRWHWHQSSAGKILRK